MRQEISSSTTILQTIIVPFLCLFFVIGAFTIIIVGRIYDPICYGFVIFVLLVAAALYFQVRRLKKVRIIDDDLLVSNYFKDIVVPIRFIKNVSQNSSGSIQTIVIEFDYETRFGNEIEFIPRFKLSLDEHPIITELKSQADFAKNAALNEELKSAKPLNPALFNDKFI